MNDELLQCAGASSNGKVSKILFHAIEADNVDDHDGWNASLNDFLGIAAASSRLVMDLLE